MHPQLPLGVRLNDNARFTNFYSGPNAEVVDGVRALVAGGDEHFIYLSGPPGSGRSHILQAACAQVQGEGQQAWYLSLADEGLAPPMLEGLEQAALICLDDVDAVAGRADWEEALFHLYNRVRDAQVRLMVAASDRPEVLGFDLPDLESRLQWGVIYRFQDLNDEQRLAALQLRAQGRGLELPDDTGQYLLRRCPRDLPALCVLLDRLDQAALVAQRRLTIPFVRSILEVPESPDGDGVG